MPGQSKQARVIRLQEAGQSQKKGRDGEKTVVVRQRADAKRTQEAAQPKGPRPELNIPPQHGLTALYGGGANWGMHNVADKGAPRASTTAGHPNEQRHVLVFDGESCVEAKGVAQPKAALTVAFHVRIDDVTPQAQWMVGVPIAPRPGNQRIASWGAGMTKDRKLFFRLKGTTVMFYNVMTPLQQWMHLCFTWDGQTAVMYRDGGKLASAPTAGIVGAGAGVRDITYTSDPTVHMGAAWGNYGCHYPLRGELADIRIYTTCLKKAEVEQVSRSPIVELPKEPPQWKVAPSEKELRRQAQDAAGQRVLEIPVQAGTRIGGEPLGLDVGLDAGERLTVRAVNSDSAAQRAGCARVVGWTLTHVNGTQVSRPADLSSAWAQAPKVVLRFAAAAGTAAAADRLPPGSRAAARKAPRVRQRGGAAAGGEPDAPSSLCGSDDEDDAPDTEFTEDWVRDREEMCKTMMEYIQSWQRNIPECDQCGSTTGVTLVCLRCLGRYYCNFNCQQRDWREHLPYCVDVCADDVHPLD